MHAKQTYQHNLPATAILTEESEENAHGGWMDGWHSWQLFLHQIPFSVDRFQRTHQCRIRISLFYLKCLIKITEGQRPLFDIS